MSRYSVTCRTDDQAVLHCLHALWRYAEDEVVLDDEPRVDVDAWRAAHGEVVLTFSDAGRRGLFLGEATRLLSGKWLRMGMSDG